MKYSGPFLALAGVLSMLALVHVASTAHAAAIDPPDDAAASTAEASTNATETAEADQKERLICRREKTIGSNRTTRVCETPEQIRQRQEATQGIMRSREASGH